MSERSCKLPFRCIQFCDKSAKGAFAIGPGREALRHSGRSGQHFVRGNLLQLGQEQVIGDDVSDVFDIRPFLSDAGRVVIPHTAAT